MTFQIQSRGDKHPHLPIPLLDGVQTTTDFEQLVEPSPSKDEFVDMWEPGQPVIGNFFLPPFQRPAVWDMGQKVRLVESLLLGVSIGSIVIVDALNLPMPSKDRFARTDRWLIDGQQRLTALLDYRHDRLTVFAGTECEHRFSDLSVVERRRVYHMNIGLLKIQTDDEDYCREIYDRLAFGGTPHTEDQRAVKPTPVS